MFNTRRTQLSLAIGRAIQENATRWMIEQWSKVKPRKAHDLYKDGDPGAPPAILDRNGQVVLGLCKVCNQAEADLTIWCPGPPENPCIEA
jgi:hypothetical protein